MGDALRDVLVEVGGGERQAVDVVRVVLRRHILGLQVRVRQPAQPEDEEEEARAGGAAEEGGEGAAAEQPDKRRR